jgi:simple sugar transport system ATP-binding protein
MNSEEVVRMINIHKVYPDGTVALRGVDFNIRRGEVVALLGENGAGKTTLMKILSGFIKPTRGKIIADNTPVKFSSPRDALKRGIAMVHQIFTLVPNFTALENIVLGYEEPVIKPFTLLKPMNLERARREVEELMSSLGLKVPLDIPVQSLPLGQRQRVEILKALYKKARVLILDEPTSFLTPLEVEELFKFIRTFKGRGNSVVFITHKIKEALAIADRIVVLRHGLVSGELEASKATPEELAVLMVGREIKLDVVLRRKTPIEYTEPVLVVRDLWVKNDLGVYAVKGVSFEVYPGEIFGIAGVEGNGQDELVESITGLRRPESGEILVNGVRVGGSSALEFYRAGSSHIPGDRERYGLVINFTLSENSLLSRQWEPTFVRGVKISWSTVKDYAKNIIERFNVITTGVDAPVRSLSGGNRQRLLVGRELTKNARLIVAVHPTKGLDIASTMYIRELLAKARDEGKAVLLVSADLEEILQLSDKVAVMYEGRFLDVRKTDEYTLEEIGLLMGGVKPEKKVTARA